MSLNFMKGLKQDLLSEISGEGGEGESDGNPSASGGGGDAADSGGAPNQDDEEEPEVQEPPKAPGKYQLYVHIHEGAPPSPPNHPPRLLGAPSPRTRSCPGTPRPKGTASSRRGGRQSRGREGGLKNGSVVAASSAQWQRRPTLM